MIFGVLNLYIIWESAYSIQVRWANVHAFDVNFSQDLTHTKIIEIG